MYLNAFYGSNRIKAIKFLLLQVSRSIKVQQWHAELSSGQKKKEKKNSQCLHPYPAPHPWSAIKTHCPEHKSILLEEWKNKSLSIKGSVETAVLSQGHSMRFNNKVSSHHNVPPVDHSSLMQLQPYKSIGAERWHGIDYKTTTPYRKIDMHRRTRTHPTPDPCQPCI